MTAPANRIAVLMPCFNEAASLPALLSELELQPECDVFVIDDGSRDASRAIVQASNAVLLPLVTNLGAWNAIQTGMRYVRRLGYQQVVTMDADGQHQVAEINRLLAAKRQHPAASVVIGSCPGRGSRMRQIAWRYFRAITGIKIEDFTSGFRYYDAAAIKLLAAKQSTLLDYQDVGVLLNLKAAGLTVVETPVSMSPRRHGKSHIYSSWLAVAYYMVVTSLLAVSKRRSSQSGVGQSRAS
jgi:glycosyltransferase involved in cell wall biosynthesis